MPVQPDVMIYVMKKFACPGTASASFLGILLGSSAKDWLILINEPLKTAARNTFPARRLNIFDDAFRSWWLIDG
jgi:hypothetical protein